MTKLDNKAAIAYNDLLHYLGEICMRFSEVNHEEFTDNYEKHFGIKKKYEQGNNNT